MQDSMKFRGQRTDNKEWIFGDLVHKYPNQVLIKNDRDGFNITHAVIPETVGLFTFKSDKEGVELFQGDVITLLDGSQAEIKYGEYEMYCPYDDQFMTNTGFYVEGKDLDLPMPLGPTECYALKIGTIHDERETMDN